MSNSPFVYAALRNLGALALLVFGGTAAAATTAPAQSVEGTVLVQVADDFVHDRAQYTYFLREPGSHRQVELKLDSRQLKRLRTGQKVRVRGLRIGAALVALPSDDAVTVIAEPVTALAAPAAARRVISLLVDIVDGDGLVHTVSNSCDGPNQITADLTFGSQTAQRNVDGCFQDASLGAVGFGGATYPGGAADVVRVRISEPQAGFSGLCLPGNWAVSADAAAQAEGVNLGAYEHKMYVLPPGTGCTWIGLANVGCGEVCQAWIISFAGEDNPNSCGLADGIAHELGHNLGFLHASNDVDTTASFVRTKSMATPLT